MTHQEEELADLYGPAAPYSDFKRGDRVRYRYETITWQGIILWVAAPQCNHPLCYICMPDGETNTFPHTILAGDLIGLTSDGQEPILRKCHYCTGFHQAEEIEYCPLNPHRQA